ncbi:hypothetical protein IE53DRAFT_321156 [Violaceomyces palustris]|uniref:Uncharacterized protein n=1 Tax=Violaceomyces palustris TaxID=1673888 RepID=A0ACD0NNR8_9BASI|nr:hypothetical protein IE53DRAFT_321156 [Violaceomyces palustris]
MAQPAGRRSTLASVDQNQSNGLYGSSIPLPSSAVKQAKTLATSTGQARQSIMLPSYSSNIQLPHSNEEYMTLQEMQQHQLQMSGRRGDAGFFAGRQSTASAGRPSMAAPTPNHRRSMGGRASIAPGSLPIVGVAHLKETRPLKERAYRNRMGLTVREYLEKTGFTQTGWDINKGIHEPTQSAFVGMFKHIYSTCIDSSYKMGADGKKFEEEVLIMMKEIKYPACDDLSKTRLAAAGSQSNWPTCLAMLEWLVNLGYQADSLGAGPIQRQEEEDDLQSLFFPFLWKCYEKFWDNQDAFPEELDELAECFHRKNTVIDEELSRLEDQHEKLKEELEEYVGKDSPLEVQQKEHELLKSDISKFTKYNDEHLQPRMEKIKKTCQRLSELLVESGEDLRAKEAEKARIQMQVDAQEMTAEEFERMSSERERLHKQLTDLATANKKAAELCWSIELSLAKKQAEAEKRLQDFHPLANAIHLIPLRLPNGDELTDLELTPGNPSTMLPPGVDVKAIVKPAIEKLRYREAEKYRKLSDTRLNLQEELDELTEQVEHEKRGLRSSEVRLEALREQIEEIARASNEEAETANSEQVKQESNINQIDHASRGSLQQAEARLSTLKISSQQTREELDMQKRAMYDEMWNAIQTIFQLRVKVADELDKIQAEQRVNGPCTWLNVCPESQVAAKSMILKSHLNLAPRLASLPLPLSPSPPLSLPASPSPSLSILLHPSCAPPCSNPRPLSTYYFLPLSLPLSLCALPAATSRLEDITLAQTQNQSSIPGSIASISPSASAAPPPPPPPPAPPAPPAPVQHIQEELHPSVVAWDETVGEALAEFQHLSSRIGGLVQEQAVHVGNTFQEQRNLVQTAAACTKPSGGISTPAFAGLIKPLQASLMAVTEIRDKNRGDKQYFNHLSTVSEGIPAAGWIAVEPKPGPFVNEMKDSAQFYANRVIKDFKDTDPDHVQWCRSFTKLLDTLKAYIMKHHTTGLVWNPKGVDPATYSSSAKSGAAPPPPPPPPPAALPPASSAGSAGGMDAVFSQLNQGESVTKGLKRVDPSQMTHKNPSLRAGSTVRDSEKPAPPKPSAKPANLKAKKPARTELEGNKWTIEFHEDDRNIVIEQTEINQTVNIFGCKNCTIQIRGKVNAVSMVSCQKTCVLIETLVSSLEITNSPSFAAQITGKAPTILLDSNDSGQLFLSKTCLDVEIVTAKCSAINVSVPVEDGEEGEFEEHALPEQMKHSIELGGGSKAKVKTEIVAHSG